MAFKVTALSADRQTQGTERFFLFQPKALFDLNYDRLAARIVSSLKPQAGEKYFLRTDPCIFRGRTPCCDSDIGPYEILSPIREVGVAKSFARGTRLHREAAAAKVFRSSDS